MKTRFARSLAPALLLGATLAGAALTLTAAQAQHIFRGARPFVGGPGSEDGAPGGVLHWSGDVDETTIISIHGDRVDDHVVRGKGVDNENVDFRGRLPHRPVQVFLRNWDGRGDVEVVRQPSPENDFTAEVRVRDPQSGRGHYEFTLAWRGGDDGDR